MHSVVSGSILNGGGHCRTLLMRPNKVERAAQFFPMSHVSVRRIYWSWLFNSQYNSSNYKRKCTSSHTIMFTF